MPARSTPSDDGRGTIEGALVLLVEDDAGLEATLHACLRDQGYRVVSALTSEQAVREAKSRNPDVIVLDLDLAGGDGLGAMGALRRCSQAPVVVISERMAEHDKVVALEQGADDYLTKPVGLRELAARVRVSLRRVATPLGRAGPFRTGDLVVDLVARKVTLRGRPVRLTPIEYKILATLVRHAGTVVSSRDLLAQVWGPQYTEQLRYLRVYMVHLRRKIEATSRAPRYVLTEPGVGYRLGLD